MLAVGTTLGSHKILTALGAGGMGEVYRAHDTRLGRDVAIKVTPSGLARDADRVHRFEQEARAAGALNHPDVCAIYDIGTHEGAPLIVMELIHPHPRRPVSCGRARLTGRKRRRIRGRLQCEDMWCS